MRLLVTGATGKVGANLIARLRSAPPPDLTIRALCHNRMMEPKPGLEVVKGTISDRGCVERAMDGVTHVVHLATCKETPDDVMDVTVKGLFWLTEAFRTSPTAAQFILIGGDASVGHFFYRPRRAGDGGDAPRRLSGLLCALESAGGGAARADPHPVRPQRLLPARAVDHGEGRFPLLALLRRRCVRRAGLEDAGAGRRRRALPPGGRNSFVTRRFDGRPLKRNFVHVDDLVEAILAALDNPATKGKLYNICMDEPVDYGEVAAYLKATRGLGSIDIPSAYHSNWLDNSRAKFDLGWRPKYDLPKLIEAAWTYERAPDDPRKVWYPG